MDAKAIEGLLVQNLGPPEARILDLAHHEDRLETLSDDPGEAWRYLEGPLPYDRCLLWDRSNAYFTDRGGRAWTSGEIPSLGIGGPGMARRHACIVHERLRHWRHGEGGPSELVLLELGAGPGIFCHYLLSALEDLDRERGTDLQSRVRILYSDFSPSVVEDARAHPLLRRWHEAGLLDFLRLDALDPAPLEEAAPGGVAVVFANYVHCCLPLTILRRDDDGRWLEKEVELLATARTDGPPGATPERLAERVSWRPVDGPDGRWEGAEELLTAVLAERGGGEIQLPYGSFRHLRGFLPHLVPGGLLLITDRPVAGRARGLARFAPTFHGESLAHPVDLELVARFARSRGHGAVWTAGAPELLQTVLIEVAPGKEDMSLEPVFRHCFEPGRWSVVPAEVLTVVEELRSSERAVAGMEHFRDLVRRYPDDAFLRYARGTLLARRGELDGAVRVLREGRERDPFGVLDFELQIGIALHRSGRTSEALESYEASLRRTPRPVTLYNIGLCHEMLQRFGQAAAAYEAAAELDPAFKAAARAAALTRLAARHLAREDVDS